jgi:hypothetical protein
MFMQTSTERLLQNGLPFGGAAQTMPGASLFAALGLGCAFLLTLAWITAALAVRSRDAEEQDVSNATERRAIR